MEKFDLDSDKQKKYDEMKNKYLEKPQSKPIEEKILPQNHSEIIDSLENNLKQKRDTLQQLNSKDILSELNDKKKQLDDTLISKTQHIQELRSDLQKLQKEIINSIKEIKNETMEKMTELYSTNENISQLTTEENALVEKIQEAQKLRISQEKELEGLRLERLNIVNKNKDTQKIQEQILEYRNRLDQITSDRSMLELEIKSQMNLLEEERQREREIISRIMKQNTN
tara:strand:+ start:124 stop:804 length:681 start_codon:yes stop_codon:yes gene_type:complete